MRLIDAEALEEEFNWIEKVTNESSIVDKEKHKTLMEDIERIQNALTVNAIPIPDGATNGDMIMAMFPNLTIYGIDKENDCITICIDDIFYQKFRYSWWNAPYEGGKEE
jgi:hypothetical protein